VKVVAKDDPDGMRSVTLVRVAQRVSVPLSLGEGRGEGVFTLLEVTIKTGRTHQIRVHLASQGHPIAGDDKYGDFELNKVLQKQGLKRMYLHAWRLQFNHPATGERIELLACLRIEEAATMPSPTRQFDLIASTGTARCRPTGSSCAVSARCGGRRRQYAFRQGCCGMSSAWV
jgi:23S rRNA pseudouridine955/2504/2580 synthase